MPLAIDTLGKQLDFTPRPAPLQSPPPPEPHTAAAPASQTPPPSASKHPKQPKKPAKKKPAEPATKIPVGLARAEGTTIDSGPDETQPPVRPPSGSAPSPPTPSDSNGGGQPQPPAPKPAPKPRTPRIPVALARAEGTTIDQGELMPRQPQPATPPPTRKDTTARIPLGLARAEGTTIDQGSRPPQPTAPQPTRKATTGRIPLGLARAEGTTIDQVSHWPQAATPTESGDRSLSGGGDDRVYATLSSARGRTASPKLDSLQRYAANIVYQIGRGFGLSTSRARELVAVAFAESSLYYYATNDQTGAAGLFQLLDSSYIETATALGGVYSARANTYAIIPVYISYWKKNPDALPGEAGRDVELSGQPASFYSEALAWLPTTFKKVPYVELVKR